MNIGELRQKVSFKRPTIIVNDNGFEVEVYETYKTAWAKVTNLHGAEYFEAAQTQKEKTIKVTIRATNGIDESLKLEFQGKLYNIEFVDEIKYLGKYMEIKALEVVASG